MFLLDSLKIPLLSVDKKNKMDTIMDTTLQQADALMPKLARSLKSFTANVESGAGTQGLGQRTRPVDRVVREAHLRTYLVALEQRHQCLSQNSKESALAEKHRLAAALQQERLEQLRFDEIEAQKKEKLAAGRLVQAAKDEAERERRERAEEQKAERIRVKAVAARRREQALLDSVAQKATEEEDRSNAVLELENQAWHSKQHRAAIKQSIQNSRAAAAEARKSLVVQRHNLAVELREQIHRRREKHGNEVAADIKEKRQVLTMSKRDHEDRIAEVSAQRETNCDASREVVKSIPNKDCILTQRKKNLELVQQIVRAKRKERVSVGKVAQMLS